MNPEVALLLETWDSIKSYLPKKERLNIAEILVRTFDDNVDISEIETAAPPKVLITIPNPFGETDIKVTAMTLTILSIVLSFIILLIIIGKNLL